MVVTALPLRRIAGLELGPDLAPGETYALCRCGRSVGDAVLRRGRRRTAASTRSRPRGRWRSSRAGTSPIRRPPASALKTNGPIRVSGDVAVSGPDGASVPAHEGRRSLCRCGASACQPMCDGSHKLAPIVDPRSRLAAGHEPQVLQQVRRDRVAVGLVAGLLVVPLVVVLGRIEGPELGDLGRDRRREPRLSAVPGGGRGGTLLVGVREDRAPVLGPAVGTLAVHLRGVVHRPEDLEQLLVAHDRRVEGHLDDLGVPGGAGADLPVARVRARCRRCSRSRRR